MQCLKILSFARAYGLHFTRLSGMRALVHGWCALQDRAEQHRQNGTEQDRGRSGQSGAEWGTLRARSIFSLLKSTCAGLRAFLVTRRETPRNARGIHPPRSTTQSRGRSSVKDSNPNKVGHSLRALRARRSGAHEVTRREVHTSSTRVPKVGSRSNSRHLPP